MSKTGKITRNGKDGKFVIGRAAAEKIGEVEGLSMPAAMNDVFAAFDRSGARPESRRAQLAAEYGTKL